MRKIHWVLLAILVIAAAAALPSSFLHNGRVRAAFRYYQSTAPPSFTVKLKETSTTADRSRTIYGFYTTARRADGSQATLDELWAPWAPGGYAERRKIRLASGLIATLTPAFKLKSTVLKDSDGKERLARSLDPKSGCQKTFLGESGFLAPIPGKLSIQFQGQEKVRGYVAYKVVQVTGQDTLTQWRAPDFGCEIIQQDRLFPNGARSREEPIFLELGEPDPALFDIPLDYQEAPPSAVALQMKRAAKGDPNAALTSDESQQWAATDKQYGQFKHQGQ